MPHSFLMKTALLAFLVFGSNAMAAVVSTMGNNAEALFADRGFQMIPVYEMPIAGDEAPARVYEIIRPRGERIIIGRLNTSCSCVRLEAGKSVFERGERAFVTLRNVRPTPSNGQTYAFYVQLTSPIRTTLRTDLFLQSDRFRQTYPHSNAMSAMQPTAYHQLRSQAAHPTPNQQPYQYQQQPQAYQPPERPSYR